MHKNALITSLVRLKCTSQKPQWIYNFIYFIIKRSRSEYFFNFSPAQTNAAYSTKKHFAPNKRTPFQPIRWLQTLFNILASARMFLDINIFYQYIKNMPFILEAHQTRTAKQKCGQFNPFGSARSDPQCTVSGMQKCNTILCNRQQVKSTKSFAGGK